MTGTADPGQAAVEVQRTQFLRALRTVDAPVDVVLEALADAVGNRNQRQSAAVAIPDVPRSIASPYLLGQAREVLHTTADRTALGAWFTPESLARRLVSHARGRPAMTVLDPACGGGAFLLAAFEAHPDARIIGRDIDPIAVHTARVALAMAGCRNIDVDVGDGLTSADDPADLIVGNPPFLSQLRAATARDDARRVALRDRFGDVVSGYVDEAALFLLHAARLVHPRAGTAVMVLPEAILATDDARAMRREVARLCDVDVVWRDTEGAFPGTPTCAVRLTARPVLASCPDHRWAQLLSGTIPDRAALQRIERSDDRSPVLSSIATATADFRDAYYLIADHVEEDRPAGTIVTGPTVPAPGDPLVTVGLIDPAHLRWGQTPVRFAKRTWQRPVARGLPEPFRATRTGPKVLVATQTKVLEALVDADGNLLPSTPVITVRTDRPWHVGAALTSPVLTAVALRRHAGAARSRQALKLSAKQVLALPLPATGSTHWDRAAVVYRQAHDAASQVERRSLLLDCGRWMMAAFDVDAPELFEWWAARLPRRG